MLQVAWVVWGLWLLLWLCVGVRGCVGGVAFVLCYWCCGGRGVCVWGGGGGGGGLCVDGVVRCCWWRVLRVLVLWGGGLLWSGVVGLGHGGGG